MNGKKKRTADRRNAGRRRSAHLHSYKKSVLMICTVLVFLSGVLAVGAVKLYAKNNAYKAQEEELAAQIKEEEKRSEEVKEYEKYVQTDEYIKETAEDKLGLGRSVSGRYFSKRTGASSGIEFQQISFRDGNRKSVLQ